MPDRPDPESTHEEDELLRPTAFGGGFTDYMMNMLRDPRDDARTMAFVEFLRANDHLLAREDAGGEKTSVVLPYKSLNGPTRERDAYCVQSMERFDREVETRRQELVNWLQSHGDTFLPVDMLYSIRNECNMGCRYCYQAQVPGEESERLDLGEAVAFHQGALEGTDGKVRFSFWGGEPVSDLDETLEWVDSLAELGGPMASLQTNAMSVRDPDAARLLMDQMHRLQHRKSNFTICVDNEREARFQEIYGGERLDWAKNILTTWLQHEGLKKMCIRYVLMRNDTTRFELIQHLLDSGFIHKIMSFDVSFNRFPREDGSEEILIEVERMTFITDAGIKTLEFFMTPPFRIGHAEDGDDLHKDLVFTDEVESLSQHRGHPECGTHWVIKPDGTVAHCITLDYTDVHDIGHISEGFPALLERYRADPILSLLRDSKHRRRTWLEIAGILDPSVLDQRFNPVPPMCQYLFSDSTLKWRITKLLALHMIKKGQFSLKEGVPAEIQDVVYDEETEEDLARVEHLLQDDIACGPLSFFSTYAS